MNDLISRQDAIERVARHICFHATMESSFASDNWTDYLDEARTLMEIIPSAKSEGYVKIPDSGIEDLSDGFHTFRQLYYQRMMLFATIVKQNRDRAWKSLRHEDGELCFGGGWFIVGIDTPEGSYTYHYEDNYFSLFDCVELERSKHWDGHTEKDVVRLLSLPSAQPEHLTDDDFETIRIHLNAYKGKLCNQNRWEEAEEYQRIIDRFMAFASAQPERKKGKWKAKSFHEVFCNKCGFDFDIMTNDFLDKMNFCPNCGADMRGEE